jgi:hypothetical protein
MVKLSLRLIAFVVGFPITLTISTPGHARCFCQCVGGRVVPLCDSTSDIRPACAPSLCPSIVPGAGTDKSDLSQAPKCEQRQLCDSLGRCRLREICR